VLAVATFTKGDIVTMTRTRNEFLARRIALKKIPNTICYKALEDCDRRFLRTLFVGQTIIVYPLEDEDPTQIAKNMLESLQANPHMYLMGGALDNIPLYPEDFKPLSKLPSQYDLRAQLATALKSQAVTAFRTLRAPLLSAGRIFSAPNKRIGRALTARKEKLSDTSESEN